MAISPDILRGLLFELAQWLEFENCELVEWVICGGAAMALSEFNVRATQDVDVVGAWNANRSKIESLDDFSEPLKSCIARVAAGHPELAGFGQQWVNLGPAKLVRFGLPPQFEKRMKSMQFGRKLTLASSGP